MKYRCEYTCRSPDGLTLLAATHIAKIATHSSSAVRIEANGDCANATDINELVCLSIEDGDVVNVTVDGRDGYDVMSNIGDVLIHQTESGAGRVGHREVPQLVPA